LEINLKASESSDDSRILEIAEELSRTLGLQQSVRRIIWSPVAWVVDRPWWLRGTLSLCSDLKGRLLPEEWRPLLAASMIYAYRFRRKRWAAGLSILAAFIGLTGTFYWYFIPFRSSLNAPACSYRGCGGELFLVPLGILVGLIAITASYFRRMKLQADLQTVKELGIDNELTLVLQKVYELLFDRTPKYRHLSGTPTIPQRLKNMAANTKTHGSSLST
jgi:hypothetical protein